MFQKEKKKNSKFYTHCKTLCVCLFYFQLVVFIGSNEFTFIVVTKRASTFLCKFIREFVLFYFIFIKIKLTKMCFNVGWYTLSKIIMWSMHA